MPQVCETPRPAKAPHASQAPFGFQLLLDLYQCRRGACDSLDLCYAFLEQLVEVLQVEAQSPPYIFRTDAQRYPDKAGLSGWIPLVESGIQIHTLTEKDFISVDIYSCRKFDIDPVLDFVENYFTPKRVDHQFLTRGVAYNT